jgi:queuosine precursor transporter
MNFTCLLILWILLTLFLSSFTTFLGKKYGTYYPIAMNASLIVMASVLANKLVTVGPFTVPAGVIVASSTFLITDILSEKWGEKEAKKAVWAGFYSLLVFMISLLIAIKWQAPDFASEKANNFAQVLGLTPRIIIASLIAYLISQQHDVWIYHILKRWTKGKYLWLRNNVSTIFSQLIDTCIFISIAFYGEFPIFNMIIGLWAVKVLIALLDTPFIYLQCYLIDKVQKQDA